MGRKLTRAVKGSPYRQYDFVVGGVRYCGSTKKTVEAEAEKVARAIHRKAMDEEVLRRNAEADLDMTWRDAVASYRKAAASNTSASQFDRPFRWLEEMIGADTPVSRIDDRLVARLVAERRAMPVRQSSGTGFASNATVNKEVTQPLSFVLRHVKEAGLATLPREPVWRRHILRTKPRVREMTIDEEMRLELVRPDAWPVFELMLLTGLRRRTALIRKDQVHWRQGHIEVVGKGDKPQQVPITVDVDRILRAAWTHDDVHVFTFVTQLETTLTRTGRTYRVGERRPMTYDAMDGIWRRICRDAGVTDLHIHDLRKTCGARIVRSTGDLMAASKALNHASISQTARAYAHITGADLLRRHAQVAADRAEMRSRNVPDLKPSRPSDGMGPSEP